jgi:hypothetical protein
MTLMTVVTVKSRMIAVIQPMTLVTVMTVISRVIVVPNIAKHPLGTQYAIPKVLSVRDIAHDGNLRVIATSLRRPPLQVLKPNQLLRLLVPQPQRNTFQAGEQRDGVHLLELRVLVVALL